jgi:hypothetical protein
MNSLYFCGNMAAAVSPVIPALVEVYGEQVKNKEIEKYAKQYFGVSLGAIAFQAIGLSSVPSLLANRALISLGVALVAAGASKMAHDSEPTAERAKLALVIENVILAANCLVGAASLYHRGYSYGLPAVGIAVYSLFKYK